MPPKESALSAAKAAEEQSAAELINYYRTRIDAFERERAEFLESLEGCSVQSAELHRLDWENRKRSDEVREVQKALSDAHTFLFEERQRLLTLQAENDELRLREIEDRKNIQQLLAMQHVPGGRAPPPPPGPSVDHLMLTIESLQAQLDEQKQLNAERIAALLEDRRIREQEEAMHRRSLSQQLEIATEKLRKAEEQLRQTTKDYILARREKQSAEERALECEAALAQERQRAIQQNVDFRRKAAEELQAAKRQAEAKLEDIAGNLRKQLKAKEDEVINLTSVHTTVTAQYERRLGELELRSQRLTEANKQLELRRHLDSEGWTADVTQLRKTLTAVDRKLHEMRLVERLEDDDRLDTILEHLRKKAPNVAPPGPPPPDAGVTRAGSDVQSIKSALAEGLRDVRVKVNSLEQRLAERKQLRPGQGRAGSARK